MRIATELLVVGLILSLSGCALPPPDLDANLSGTVATSALAMKREFNTQGVRKIALIVKELPYASFDCFGCHFWVADPTDSYSVPQEALVPEGYLREQMLVALNMQTGMQVVDRSEYGDAFAESLIRVPWHDVYAIPEGSPAYALLQTMRGEGIDAVLYIDERDNNPFRFGNFLNRGGYLLDGKGVCNCPPGNDKHELIVYAALFAAIIGTSDGKEIDGRDYRQGSVVTKHLEWQTSFDKYSPEDVAIMRDAIQGRERVNAVQLLRTFKILPAVSSPN